MRDVVFILLTLGFFALAYAYISGCARVLGPDPTGEAFPPASAGQSEASR